MALLKHISRLFGTKDITTDSAFDGIESPEVYLKLTTKCLKEVQAMSTLRVSTESPKFNSEQCTYLAVKLKVAVDSAHSFLLKHFPASLGSEDMAKCLETFKLLFASAKQVQSFIQSCCKLNAYSLAAVILPNLLEHIKSVNSDLELCRIAFSGSQKREATHNATSAEAVGVDQFEVKIVNWPSFDKSKASIDKKTLLGDLKALSQLSTSSDEERMLATFLLERLERAIQGSSIESKVCEVDYRSLHQKEKLGSGATCTVHRAIWLGVPVAMKTFIGPNHPIFKKEVAMLAGFSHPNVISLLCSSMDDRWCAIVMELMDEDLFSLIQSRTRLHRQGNHYCAPFTDLESIHLILQVSEGMLYLHENWIVHRDLKSNNIFVKHVKAREVGIGYVHAKVADFGLSKTKESTSSFSNQTPNVGTSRWMAPEVIKFQDAGDGKDTRLMYDPFKADIYSFAIVCYEILSGDLPFSTTSNPKEVKEKVLLGARPLLPNGCPKKLKDLIEKCWSNDAKARPSFDVICKELRLLKCSLTRGSTCRDELRVCEEESVPGLGPQMQDVHSNDSKELLSLVLPGGDTVQESAEPRLDYGQRLVGSGPLAYYHRGVAVRLLRDYLHDLAALYDGLLENISEDIRQRRLQTVRGIVEEYRMAVREMEETNTREPNGLLTWQERDNLKSMLEDYSLGLEEFFEYPDSLEGRDRLEDQLAIVRTNVDVVDAGMQELVLSEKLAKEFKRIMVQHTLPLTLPDRLDETETKDITEQVILPPAVLKRLQAIMQNLPTNGGLEKCVESYREIRSTRAFVSLQGLKLDYLKTCSPEFLDKIDWDILQTMIKKWSEHVEVAVKVLYASEKRLCEQVLGKVAEGAYIDECLYKVARIGMDQFISFGEGIARGHRAPEKLFRLLDMYDSLDKCMPSVNTLFDGECCRELRSQLRELQKMVVAQACRTFWEFKQWVVEQQEGSMAPDGSVTKLSSYVVNYLKYLVSDFYNPIMDEVLKIEQSWRGQGRVDWLLEFQEESGLASGILLFMQALERQVEGRSNEYSDPALRLIFLMNNLWYMRTRSKNCELGPLLGEQWFTEQSRKVEQHALAYQIEVWGGVLKCLSREGFNSQGGRSVVRELVLKRIRDFTASFDSACQRHQRWIIAAKDLRESIKDAVLQAVVSSYKSFLTSFEYLFETGSGPENFYKYTPENIEHMITEWLNCA